METVEAATTSKSLLNVDKATKMFMKKMAGSKAHVGLPKDDKTLQELYSEVSFYEITELQKALGSCTMSSRVVQMFSGNTANPLEAGAKWFVRLRNVALAMGAAWTTTVVWIQSELDWVLTRIGIRQDEEKQIEEKVISDN